MRPLRLFFAAVCFASCSKLDLYRAREPHCKVGCGSQTPGGNLLDEGTEEVPRSKGSIPFAAGDWHQVTSTGPLAEADAARLAAYSPFLLLAQTASDWALDQESLVSGAHSSGTLGACAQEVLDTVPQDGVLTLDFGRCSSLRRTIAPRRDGQGVDLILEYEKAIQVSPAPSLDVARLPLPFWGTSGRTSFSQGTLRTQATVRDGTVELVERLWEAVFLGPQEPFEWTLAPDGTLTLGGTLLGLWGQALQPEGFGTFRGTGGTAGLSLRYVFEQFQLPGGEAILRGHPLPRDAQARGGYLVIVNEAQTFYVEGLGSSVTPVTETAAQGS